MQITHRTKIELVFKNAKHCCIKKITKQWLESNAIYEFDTNERNTDKKSLADPCILPQC